MMLAPSNKACATHVTNDALTRHACLSVSRCVSRDIDRVCPLALASFSNPARPVKQ